MSTISIIIPAYNQGQYLAAAVQAGLDQTYPDVEVIVVDDGSTDDTAVVAQSFSDPRVRYVYQENRGLSGARNTGIRHASGDYLTYLDSDDLFLPQKVAILLAEMEKRPSLGFVAGQSIPIDENGSSIGKQFDKGLPAHLPDLLLGNPLHVGSVLLRREWQERVGFFDETLRSYEDWDMWLRLAVAGCEMGWVDQPVSLYRFHRHQMTRDGRQMTTATFAVLENFFRRSDLPAPWQAMRDRAYSRAHLRAAAQAYRVPDALQEAQEHLATAVQHDPILLANHAEPLARILSGWTDLPKIADPLAYLETIYNNLPPNLPELAQRRQRDLGQIAMRQAYQAYEKGDMLRAKTAVRKAIRCQPHWLTNRGALSILLRTHLTPDT
ncbi:MAG: glycosyltransferase [Ardenticatenaceae bacterium]|nr:glycosyltransferase [Anaerolineales bacterium]MCB8923683.1 glycosyltransferase [Ardenticatenaceae bacterium]